MKIAVLKEAKRDENRVALQPCQARILVDNGHEVFVEQSAGIQSGYQDDEYVENGAKISSKETALNNCELILKVKAPLESEYGDYGPEQTLFTYLHFDENISPDNIRRLISNNMLGIAMEWVKKDDIYPLLLPMSKLTGYLFAQKATELCARYKGLLCGKYEECLFGSHILVIGVGTIGMSVLKYAMDNHFHINVVDKHTESINDRLNQRLNTSVDYIGIHNFKVIKFDCDNPSDTKGEICNILPDMDIVINCAVRRPDLPKSTMEYLIDAEMIKLLKKSSIVCDATACDKDMIETAVSSESLYNFDIIHDVIHYNCDHIPSYVGRTATDLLTQATFPYILEMANNGIIPTVRSNEFLREGVSCYKGILTHEYSALKKALEYTNILQLIGYE